MNMETRKTSFEEKLKENLGAEYKATFPQRMEKQDEEFLRVGVQKSGESAGIWIYLNGSEFHWLDNEEDIQRAVTKVIEEYKKKRGFLNGPYLTGDSFSNVKNNLVCALANREDNEEVLKYIPHIRYYDMVAYFLIFITVDGESYVRTVVNEDLDRWEVELQDVLETAKSNTDLNPPVIEMVGIKDWKVISAPIGNTFGEMLQSIKSHQEQKNPMYVLSNQSGLYGASNMIDNHLLGQISESCNDSLLILPVDIHEIILIPSRKNRTSIADWKAVIHALNIENKGVKLSDLVYLFDRADKKLHVAKKDDFQA